MSAILIPRAGGKYDFLSKAAKQHLSAMLNGRRVELAGNAGGTDRHSRLPAQVYLKRGDDVIWVQGSMLQAGLGRSYALADEPCIRQMQKLELTARKQKLGLWKYRKFAVLSAASPDVMRGLQNTFQIVEGYVKRVSTVRGRVFLNFGDNWRTDFTASISKKHMGQFATAGIDLHELAGHKLRVRGWLELRNGPMISVSTPGQIELPDQN
jgi:hypothetical protein